MTSTLRADEFRTLGGTLLGVFSFNIPTVRTTTSETLVLTDEQSLVQMSNAGANTLTVPPNSSVAFPVGTFIKVEQTGAGTTSVAQGAGVTIRALSGTLALSGQYSAGELIKIATDEWLFIINGGAGGGGTGGTEATVQTTNATVTNIATGALASGEVATITASGQGTESATGDLVWFTISGACKNVAGTTSLVGTPVIVTDGDAGTSTWGAVGNVINLEADDTGDNWELTVEGEAAHTIDWKILYNEVKQ
jgi:hypothetical protein